MHESGKGVEEYTKVQRFVIAQERGEVGVGVALAPKSTDSMEVDNNDGSYVDMRRQQYDNISSSSSVETTTTSSPGGSTDQLRHQTAEMLFQLPHHLRHHHQRLQLGTIDEATETPCGSPSDTTSLSGGGETQPVDDPPNHCHHHYHPAVVRPTIDENFYQPPSKPTDPAADVQQDFRSVRDLLIYLLTYLLIIRFTHTLSHLA